MRLRANRFRRQKARTDSLEEILSHRAYTTESVKRLFTAIEHGQATASSRSACWPISSKYRSRHGKSASEEFLHEELEYVVVGGLEGGRARHRSLMRAESDGRATFLVHPESARIVRRAGSFVRAPQSSGTCATLCA